jgi:hypothetical protein
MPDTQVNNKTRVTDQTEGGNNNTWGQIADTNFTKMARAIAGYNAKAISGDTTLSQTESEYAYQKFTGTLGSAATVTMVQYSGLQIVENDAGQAITYKMATGTGVSIPDGQKMLVFSDGANCFNAIDYFVGDMKIAGHLSLTGTGTNTFSGGLSIGKNLVGAGTATSTLDGFTIDGGSY